ncbi:hypothetical protein CsSME_00015290 [Camellia sinensis var. sinensis]
MKIQCDVCNKDEASVFCSADEAALCEGCDERVHHANKLATKHIRFSLLLPSSSNQSESRPLCDICQERRAILFCQEDRAILCRECDIPIHKANEHTLKHNRFLLTGVKLSCPSSSSSSSSNGFDLPTYSHIKSSVISNQSSNPTSSIHYDKASLPSTNTTPCKANHDHDHHYRYVSQENSVSLSTSSISEYLMETLPGWRVDDFLDPSCFPHGFCKFSNHDLDKGWYPFPSEDLVICVPQAPIQSSHNTPLCPPQTGVINGVFKGSEEELDLMKFSRKWNEDGFTVPQISPPLKKSRQFW